jgi:hypothetical protein
LQCRTCCCCTTSCQVGLSWLNRWATNLVGKDEAPVLCQQACGVLLAAGQTGEALAGEETNPELALQPRPAQLQHASLPPWLLACCPLHSLPAPTTHAHTDLGPDELAAQLLDLMGDAAFEAIGALLDKR